MNSNPIWLIFLTRKRKGLETDMLTGKTSCETKAKIGWMLLEAKKHQPLPANQQRPSQSGNWFSVRTLRRKQPRQHFDLGLRSKPPELWENNFLFLKPRSLWYIYRSPSRRTHHILFRFPEILIASLFCSRAACHTQSSRFFRLLLAVTVSQTSLIFWQSWQFWGIMIRHFIESSTIDVCLVFFIWLDCGYKVLGGRPQRKSAIFITSYEFYLLSTWFITVDVDLDHLAGDPTGVSTVTPRF